MNIERWKRRFDRFAKIYDWAKHCKPEGFRTCYCVIIPHMFDTKEQAHKFAARLSLKNDCVPFAIAESEFHIGSATLSIEEIFHPSVGSLG